MIVVVDSVFEAVEEPESLLAGRKQEFLRILSSRNPRRRFRADACLGQQAGQQFEPPAR